jgi:hypothetical protein
MFVAASSPLGCTTVDAFDVAVGNARPALDASFLVRECKESYGQGYGSTVTVEFPSSPALKVAVIVAVPVDVKVASPGSKP